MWRVSTHAAVLMILGASGVTAQATSDQLESAVASLEWRNIGPTIMGGRVADLAVVESDPSIFYVGTATGGVWKTTNAGTTFEPIFEDEETSSIGDITVSPSNPNVVWLGTGEPQNRQSSPWGNGVYRSTDAGLTWTHLGLSETHHISRIQVHPHNPDIAYVAAVGHLWGPNPERGVYKTTDGGDSWELVHFVDEHTGAIDLVMDPGDPQTLFVAMYQRQRTGWGFNGGGPGSGIYRTTDGGETWRELSDGLPRGDMGRIGLDIFRGDGNLVFALVEADATTPGQGFGGGGQGARARKTGVYRSQDRGETWEQVSTTNNRPMYYSQIRIDPNDPERLYSGGSALYKSVDGGQTFTNDAADGVHLDHHALWIDPANSDHLIVAGDGGVSVSWDRSDNWRQVRNLPIAQFYEIGVDMQEPYHVCGGLQDNGSWCAPSDTWSNQGIRTRDWYNVGSGDGFYTVFHPDNPRIMFAESQGGNISRVDLETNERARSRPVARPGDDGEDRSLRWNWDSPIVWSTHDANTVYIGSNILFRSTDLGTTWQEISPDLTHAIDRGELEIMGVLGSAPMMSPNDGISSYGNLTSLTESPLDADLLYTGSDDGRVHVTRDGGANWADITDNFPDLPEHTYVTRLVSSGFDEGTVYATFDGHRNDDFDAYVYVSTDFGSRWRMITEGLPANSVNAFAQHPRSGNLLFVGNEQGVYFSINGGGQWTRLKNNLPTVPVDDIVIHPRDNDLVLGTHGRGIWIMSDITPLEELSPEVLAADAHLFSVRTATSYNPFTPQGWTPSVYAAANPPAGALIRYHLGGDSGAAKITILDTDGEVVRELNGARGEGGHEVVWDLRLPRPYQPAPGQGGGGFRGAPRGPKVLPGSYTVRLESGDQVLETQLTVRLDPRVSISRADLLARQEALMSAYELAGPANDASLAVRRLTGQLDEVDELVGDREDVPDAVTEALASLQDDLRELGRDLNQAAGGARGAFAIDGVTARPSADQLWALDQAWEKVPGLIERLNVLITDRMPALNRQLDEHGVRPDPGEAVAVPRRGGGS